MEIMISVDQKAMLVHSSMLRINVYYDMSSTMRTSCKHPTWQLIDIWRGRSAHTSVSKEAVKSNAAVKRDDVFQKRCRPQESKHVAGHRK